MSSNYCVTFRIADETVGGQSYRERYERLIANVRREEMGFWEGTTSFFFVESSLDTNRFAAMATAGLSPRHDIVVIFDPFDMSAVQFGPVPEPDILASFLPRIKKAA